MHGQNYNQYVQDDANLDRCQVIKRCQKLPYRVNEYLNYVRSPHVRSILTKLRLDTNCTLDSISRSYRGKGPPIRIVKHVKQHKLYSISYLNVKILNYVI